MFGNPRWHLANNSCKKLVSRKTASFKSIIMRIFFYGNKAPCLELDGHKYDYITIVNNTKPLFLYLYIACVRKQLTVLVLFRYNYLIHWFKKNTLCLFSLPTRLTP